MKSENQKGIILLGTARRGGNSFKIANYLNQSLHFQLIDLNDYLIYPFNYEHDYPEDDAFSLIVQEILAADVLVFVTPVYWYSVSTTMKLLMDRLTDLITICKQQGRALKGKRVFSVSCGPDHDMPSYFHEPFRLTAEYLDMSYHGFVHTWIAEKEPISEEVIERLNQFQEKIKRVLKS